MTFAGIWSELWPIPSAWRALSMTTSGRWRMPLVSSRAGTPSRMRPRRIRNAGPPALRTPVWPLPTRLCRLLTRSRVWGATIPARAAAARSSRSAAWTESFSGRRYRAYCEESAPQTRAIRRSSDPFSLATLTDQVGRGAALCLAQPLSPAQHCVRPPARSLCRARLDCHDLHHLTAARRSHPGSIRDLIAYSFLLQVLGEVFVHLEHGDAVLAEHGLELLIGHDLALVLRVLELVRLDVVPNLADHLGTGQRIGTHHGGKLVGGLQGLHQSRVDLLDRRSLGGIGLLRGRAGVRFGRHGRSPVQPLQLGHMS